MVGEKVRVRAAWRACGCDQLARGLRDGRGESSHGAGLARWAGASEPCCAARAQLGRMKLRASLETALLIPERATRGSDCRWRCREVASRSRWRSARVHRGSASTPPGGYLACMTSASASRPSVSVPIKVGVELEEKGREACRAAESNLAHMSRFRHRPCLQMWARRRQWRK
jgi:hypothetical protein